MEHGLSYHRALVKRAHARVHARIRAYARTTRMTQSITRPCEAKGCHPTRMQATHSRTSSPHLPRSRLFGAATPAQRRLTQGCAARAAARAAMLASRGRRKQAVEDEPPAAVQAPWKYASAFSVRGKVLCATPHGSLDSRAHRTPPTRRSSSPPSCRRCCRPSSRPLRAQAARSSTSRR